VNEGKKLMSKPGPAAAWDKDIEILMRHWPHVPDYVRRTLVEMVSHYKPEALGVRFPTPKGVKWEDVDIVLLSPEEVMISVGSVVQKFSFASIGLADVRHENKPRTEWRMLRTYAENPEPDAYYKLPARRGLKTDISRFRGWLKGFFGIAGDPLKPFKPARWLPRFKIRADY
jgi:hypothetical protein